MGKNVKSLRTFRVRHCIGGRPWFFKAFRATLRVANELDEASDEMD